MTRVKYTITIHTSRGNKIRNTISSVRYQNIPTAVLEAGGGDYIRFYQQKVIIKASRNRKRLNLEDILEYRQNTIYAQIFKTVLYLYLGNERRVEIRSIDVETPKNKESRIINPKSQPLSRDFKLRNAIPASVMDVIWEESTKSEYLRRAVSHYLRGKTSKDRYFVFERYWRAFEQLAYWHHYHSPLPKKPEETEAMRSIRTFIDSNPPSLSKTISFVDKVGSRQIDKLHWRKLIIANYPYTGDVRQINLVIDNLIRKNQDIRLVRMFRKACDIHKKGLVDHALKPVADTLINSYVTTHAKNNANVLALIVCKYCYFYRNKMFHGQEADYTFSFSNHTEDDDITDFLNSVLELLVFDLICGFNIL